MTSLDELVKIDGVLLACEFNKEGKCDNIKANCEMPGELADKACEYINTVTTMFNTLAGSFTDISMMNWTPQHGWAYIGGDWTCAVGGNRAVFVQTSKADFNKLHEMLIGEKVEEKVSQSI